MLIKKLPAGTRMYLNKRCDSYPLYIKPDHIVENDNLYVAYDVRVNDQTVIPRGTRIVGDWITESSPVPAAQFQMKRIYLQPSGQDIVGDSDVFEALGAYNRAEVENAGHLYKLNEYKSVANLIRRTVYVRCFVQTVSNTALNSIYLDIATKEIPITLSEDFVPFPIMPITPLIASTSIASETPFL